MVAVAVGEFCSPGYTHEILLHSFDGKGNVFVLDSLKSDNNGWFF